MRPTALFPVRVANLTDTDIWLKPRTSIGVLHAVSAIETDVQFRRITFNEEMVVLGEPAAR